MSEALRRPPRQERSERTVAQILAAADSLFGELGIAQTTTTKVAKRAGVSVGAIYRFFPDKEAMAVALTDLYIEKRDAVYVAVAQEVLAGGNDTIDRAVSTMIDGLNELSEQHPGYSAVNAHFNPGTVTEGDHPTLKSQGEALIAWFETAPATLTRAEAEVIAEYTMVMTRTLLDRARARPQSQRQPHLAEAKFVLTTYLRARLLGTETPTE